MSIAGRKNALAVVGHIAVIIVIEISIAHAPVLLDWAMGFAVPSNKTMYLEKTI